MELTKLERDLLVVTPVGPIVGGVLVRTFRAGNDDVTHEDLRIVESDLEKQVADLKMKLDEVIKTLNIVVTRM
jgi:hypothetical protein